jgi:predicted RNA-binding Zn ribbon-like protein
MSWRLVDGVAVPDAVAGHPALDFCNTRAGWGSASPKEYLVEPRVLTVWAADAGLLPSGLASSGALTAGARPEPADGGALLARAVALREALYPVALGRGTAQDWDVVSAEASRARARQRLVALPDGRGGCWVTDPADPEAALTAVAGAVADLLVSPLAAAVSACPGQGCGWLFADPRGRRRWCSMAVCGNRAKARRHAIRHA